MFLLFETPINIYGMYWLVHDIPNQYIKDLAVEKSNIDTSEVPSFIREKVFVSYSKPIDIINKVYDFYGQFGFDFNIKFHVLGKLQGIPALKVCP